MKLPASRVTRGPATTRAAPAPSRSLAPAAGTQLTHLQRGAGNLAIQVSLGGVGPMATVGRSGDPEERRAEAMAERFAARAPVTGMRDRLTEDGRMPASVRRDYEAFFATDFSEVRIHTGKAAQSSARALNAHALTHGTELYFGKGEFAPETPQGRRLLAHELAHVAQAGGPTIVRRAEVTGGTVETEREAQIDADVQRIIAILNRWYYSDADEQQVIDILTKWALAGSGDERLTPLDRVIAKLIQRTTTVGIMGQTTSYYSLIMNHFDRVHEVRNLRDRYARTFQTETGMREVSILDQDWMQTAGKAWSPIKEGLYKGLISGMRGAQAAALSRLRALIVDWPPAAQLAGAMVIDQIELTSDTLISLVLAIVGLVVGLVSGIAKLVWGLLQFLWGLLDTFMLSVLANFSQMRREQLDQRITAFREGLAGLANFFPALRILTDRWSDEFSKASPDRQTVMIGELTGEIEAIFASLLAGGRAAGALPKLPVSIPVPAPALAYAGPSAASGAGAITIDVAAAGPPLIAGTLAGTTAMAVSEEAKGGGPPEQAPKEPPGGGAQPKETTPKKPLPSERKFQPGEWEKLTPEEQQKFVKQWMEEHGVTTLKKWNDHHVWPKYLGGPEAGRLETLDERLHQLFHAGLDLVLPKQAGEAYYSSLSVAEKIENIKTLLRYTRDFDVTYSTKVYPKLVEALKGTPYEALPGTL